MKKIIAVMLCFALLAAGVLVFAGCGKRKTDEEDPFAGGVVDGGWAKAESPAITEEFGKVFEKAAAALTGVQYEPVAYLASQVVAGMNHCVLCKAIPTAPGADAAYAILYIYEDLNGGAAITGIMNSETGVNVSDADGGWSEPVSPAVPEEALRALAKACETLTGVEYTPVALLAAQVAAGMNYRMLCETRATVPGAQTEYVIVTVYADPQGNAEITETAGFTAEAEAQIPNPLVEYGSDMGSLAAAEEAVGFTLTLPESIVPENFIVISDETLEAVFDGGYIRKALGDGDISGDYNEYGEIRTVAADGREVTLKGNAGKVMLAIWTHGDYTYCVGVSGGTDEAGMLSLVNEIR